MSNNKHPYESEFWVFLWHFFFLPEIIFYVCFFYKTDICYALLFVSGQFSTVSYSFVKRKKKMCAFWLTWSFAIPQFWNILRERNWYFLSKFIQIKIYINLIIQEKWFNRWLILFLSCLFALILKIIFWKQQQLKELELYNFNIMM